MTGIARGGKPRSRGDGNERRGTSAWTEKILAGFHLHLHLHLFRSKKQ